MTHAAALEPLQPLIAALKRPRREPSAVDHPPRHPQMGLLNSLSTIPLSKNRRVQRAPLRTLGLGLISALAMLSCGRARESMSGYLQKHESVAHVAANGEVLAIAIGYNPPFGKNLALPKLRGGVVLACKGRPPIRTPLRVGAMRSIVAAPSGFVAARVTYDKDAHSTAYVFGIDLYGQVSEMLPLKIDLVGLWVNADGSVYVYSPKAVFRWIKANPVWEKLPLDPAVSDEPIRRIVELKDGSSLVVTDRSIKGFGSLQKPPIFIKDLNVYPEPIQVYGDDQWWVVTENKGVEKISLIGENGATKLVALPPTRLIENILFGSDKVFIVCGWEDGDVHKSSYYILNRDGSGTLQGPFMLPDDTIETCFWRDSIVSGGASNRLYMTSVMPK